MSKFETKHNSTIFSGKFGAILLLQDRLEYGTSKDTLEDENRPYTLKNIYFIVYGNFFLNLYLKLKFARF